MGKTIKGGLFLALAVMLCLSLLPMTALAEGDFRTEDGVLVRYNGSSDAVVIPDGVTSIGNGAFQNCINLTSVTIPDSVTSIGNGAFLNCKNLTSITIPDSVTSIESQAFARCGSLARVTIPNSVTSIGGFAFMDCSSLTSVTMPNSITSIGDYTFNNCIALIDVTIPNSVTSIGESAFYFCSSLTNVEIPSSVTNIGAFAFGYCISLTSIVIPDGVTNIQYDTFSNCTSMASASIPNSVTSIGGGAFYYCTSLTSVILPDSVTSIGNNAFNCCTNLTSIVIPESVTEIGYDQAFGVHLGVKFYVKAGSYAESWLKIRTWDWEKIIFYDDAPALTDPPPTTALTPPAEAPNLDSASGWAHESLNQAYSAGLVPTELQSKYSQATTRAEFCALAVALYETVTGKEISERATFNDTNDVNVEKMAGLAVVNGVGGGNFAPDTTLTREQAATLLSRLANVIGKPLAAQAATFNDNAQISSWAIDAVGQMQAAGIMGGVGENTFAPKNDYAREQSIITILRLYNLMK